MESSHRIGIIDDDPAVRDSMHLLLEGYGYRVSEYASATDYLKNPDAECLLLIDLSMSDLNGMDLIDILRGGEIETPVILLTDIAEPQLSPRISAAGNCSRLDKPVTAGALLDCIGTTIRRAECAARHM